MNTTILLILVAALSAVAALGTYILIRRIMLKGQKEEIIRKAADEVNRRIKVYQDRTPEKPMLELMSFAALNICMTNITMQETFRNLSSEEQRLARELESYLENIDKNSR